MLALWQVGGQYLEPLLGPGPVRWRSTCSARSAGRSATCCSDPPSAMDPRCARTPATGTPAPSGASGAVFGLFGALLVLNRKLGRTLRRASYVIIVINAVLGFVIPNVAWQAHLGGLVTGAAAAAVIAATSSRERRAWQWPGWPWWPRCWWWPRLPSTP